MTISNKCPRCGEAEHPGNCTVPAQGQPRFFIDHGVIHDRITGKHVTTNEDSVFEDGVEACCNLLNELSET